jgi:hypothetical protein
VLITNGETKGNKIFGCLLAYISKNSKKEPLSVEWIEDYYKEDKKYWRYLWL